MGAPLPVREYASAAEMQAHAAELRAKMFAPRPAVVPKPASKPAQRTPEPTDCDPAADPEPKVCEPSPALRLQSAAQLAGRQRYSGADCMRMTAEVTGFTAAQLSTPRRPTAVVKARQIGFWLAATYSERSLPDTGRRYGGRDHTTVLHGKRRVDGVIADLELIVTDDPIAIATTLWTTDWPSPSKPRRPCA